MLIRRGDIYYADLSPVVGSEQGGVRPVLIIQNNVGNKYSPTVIAAAITSRGTKADLPTHIKLYADHSGLSKDSVVLLEQIRTLDKQRLRKMSGEVSFSRYSSFQHNRQNLRTGIDIINIQEAGSMNHEIYLDILFCTNFIIDYMILLSVKRFLSLSCRLRRLLPAAAAGGLCSFVILLPPLPSGLSLIISFACACFVVGAAFAPIPRKMFFKAAAAFFLISFGCIGY